MAEHLNCQERKWQNQKIESVKQQESSEQRKCPSVW